MRRAMTAAAALLVTAMAGLAQAETVATKKTRTP